MVTFEKTADGNLRIVLSEEGRAALGEVEAIRDRHGIDAALLVLIEPQLHSACDLARCVPLAAERSEASRYADEAFTLLDQAVTAGWADAAKTATDPDLAPLRDRDDFRRLVAEFFDRAFPANPFAR